MKMFQDAHLEVKKFFSGSFCTNPYEAGWADEAIFFILVEKQLGEPVMTARVQLSQDGVHFTDDNQWDWAALYQGAAQLRQLPPPCR